MKEIDTVREAIAILKDRIPKALYALEVPSRNPYDAYPELKDAELALAALSAIDPDAKHIDPIYDPAIASVRNKQLASLQSDVEEYQETSPGVWQTPSMAHARAAWIDMIQAGEHGPKAQHKMIETLAKHFKSHDDAIRRECAERFTQEWRNAFPALDDTPPEWTITAILGKEAKK